MAGIGSKLLLGMLHGLAWVPLPLLRLLGNLIGLGVGWLGGRRLQTALTNLRLCYSEREEAWHQSMARKSLMHEACNLLEMPRLWRLSAARLERLAVQVSGLEYLAQNQERGIIFITPHFGSWEFVSLFIVRSMPLVSLYRPLKQPELDRYVLNGRQHTGATLVPADRQGVRTLLRTLQAGHGVGVLPDHVPRRKEDGVMAPFFGVQANTGVLVSRLAQRQGVKVLLAQARRCRGGFAITFRPADSRIYAPDKETAAAGVNATVESCIADDIAQYWWSYPRFRKRLIEPESLYS